MRQRFPLTERRVRVHATLLAIGLWGGALVNLSSPGLMARNGHPKGEDFLQFWVMGRLVHEGDAGRLYVPAAHHALTARELPEAAGFLYLPVYGPQVALAVAPLGRLSYLPALAIWTALTVLLYAASLYLTWRRCPTLRAHGKLTALLALGFPALWYLVMDGQSSAFVLFAFTTTWLALERRRRVLAGVLLGLVFYKPQLGMAAGVTFVFLREWRVVGGAILSATAQWGLASIIFGTQVLRDYVTVVGSMPTIAPLLQPKLWQMHSLRAFFELLLPESPVATAGYVLTSAVSLAMCVRTWRRTSELSLAFAQLLLVTPLVSPHLFVYDLVLLGPALVLVEECVRSRPEFTNANGTHWLVYAVYALPLFGPLTEHTRLQFSVVAVAILSWYVYRWSNRLERRPVHW